MSSQSSFPPPVAGIVVIKGILGGVANSVGATVTSPLDVLKIRFQTQGELHSGAAKTYNGVIGSAKVIVRDEGVRGLYKGLTVSIAREMTFTSARFALYEPFRKHLSVLLDNRSDGGSSLRTKIVAGLASGLIAAAMFNPTDVLKIRLQADVHGTRYPGVWHALRQIVRTEGIKDGLYKGVTTTMVRAALLNSAQLASYDFAKHRFIDAYAFRDSMLTHFIASFFAGFVTSAVTSPVDVARTRIMNEKPAPGQPRVYPNLLLTLYKIVTSEGLFGLYKGFVPSYTRLGTCTVVALVVSEQLRILLGIPTL
eukprot:TRINITY_DN8492_c0_g1_i1.p1 TRINITY_DN8492_c0_g1~~TRINITY_DN8492_c0_g1_i1.p1  ORF type:complete len:310 (+),score=68.78 TRINITY_DN8492_c0_g1_i1:547-1476(+)